MMKEKRDTNDSRNPALPVDPVHILYAEDEPSLANLVTQILESQGWRVTCVTDGKRAVQAWEKTNFDLILMDLQMPNMDGLEATRAIRRQEKSSHVPILGLTATGKRDLCLRAGMDGCLTKPFHRTGLIEAITRHLKS